MFPCISISCLKKIKIYSEIFIYIFSLSNMFLLYYNDQTHNYTIYCIKKTPTSVLIFDMKNRYFIYKLKRRIFLFRYQNKNIS